MAQEYFISYRRKAGGDSQAREVYNILCKYVGKDNVFFDRESIHEGSWRKYLETSLPNTAHFVLIVNEASASDAGSVYYEEIALALKNDNLKADFGRITVIVYDNDSYKKLLADFPELSSRDIQKVTYNGEYGNNFEERLCKHFGFDFRSETNNTNNMTTVRINATNGQSIENAGSGNNFNNYNYYNNNSNNKSGAGKWVLIILLLAAVGVGLYLYIKGGGKKIFAPSTESRVQQVLDSALKYDVEPSFDIFAPDCQVYEVSGSMKVDNGTIDQHLINLRVSQEIKRSKLEHIEVDDNGLVTEIEVKDIH